MLAKEFIAKYKGFKKNKELAGKAYKDFISKREELINCFGDEAIVDNIERQLLLVVNNSKLFEEKERLDEKSLDLYSFSYTDFIDCIYFLICYVEGEKCYIFKDIPNYDGVLIVKESDLLKFSKCKKNTDYESKTFIHLPFTVDKKINFYKDGEFLEDFGPYEYIWSYVQCLVDMKLEYTGDEELRGIDMTDVLKEFIMDNPDLSLKNAQKREKMGKIILSDENLTDLLHSFIQELKKEQTNILS